MAHEIRTRWHKLVMLAKDPENIYLTAPPVSVIKESFSQPWKKFATKPEDFSGFLESLKDVPKFVMARNLLVAGKQRDYYKSMLAMKRANVLRLPYPAMIIEMPRNQNGANDEFVFLRDLQSDAQFEWETPSALSKNYPFYGYVMRITTDWDGAYVVVSPSIQYVNLRRTADITCHPNPEEIKLWGDKDKARVAMADPEEAWLTATASPLGVLKDGPETDDLINATFMKDSAHVVRALSAATLLMNTEGVEREVIETKRLNKRREASGKVPVPQHTYIYIGRIYRSAMGGTAEKYDERRSPRPHWRRGHNRRFVTGHDRQGRIWKYVPPRLVAFHGVGAEPAKPSYKVTDKPRESK